MCQYQLNGTDITFIFPPQFGLLTANVADFMESYNLAESCVGCTNKTVQIRQLTNITLNVDDIPLCQLESSTSDFYYVILSLFVLSMLLPLAFSLYRKLQIYRTFFVHFILYFQQSLFILFSSNVLLQANFNILFYYAMPFQPELSKFYTQIDSVLQYSLNNFLLNILYSVLVFYAIITVSSILFFVLTKIFPIKQLGMNWRYLLKNTMNQIFLLFVPFYLITMMPLSGVTILLTNIPGNDGVLVFLFFYLFLPLLALIYLSNKYNTFQMETWQINTSYFSLFFHSIHQFANKPFIALIVLQLIQGFFLSLSDTPRYILLLMTEFIWFIVVYICSRPPKEEELQSSSPMISQSTSTSQGATSRRTSITIGEARKMLHLDQQCDGFVPLMFSLAKMVLYLAMLISSFIAKQVKMQTICGFVVIGIFITSVVVLLIMMLKQSIPEKEIVVLPRYETPPDSPVERRHSIRRLDWLHDEFDEVANPKKIMERAEMKKGTKPLRINTQFKK